MKKGKRSNVVHTLIIFISLIIFCLAIISIYNSIYKVLYKTDIPYFFNKALFKVEDNNYSPEYHKYDYLLLEKKDTYGEDNIIIYKYHNNYRIAKVLNYNAGGYTIVDKNNNYSRIDNTLILGYVKYNFYKLGFIFSTPLLILSLGVLIAAYFILGIYEKDS